MSCVGECSTFNLEHEVEHPSFLKFAHLLALSREPFALDYEGTLDLLVYSRNFTSTAKTFEESAKKRHEASAEALGSRVSEFQTSEP